MRRHLLSALAGCAVALALALSVPRTALALPYHAADSELEGTAYAVLSPTTGELDFVRSTETHRNKSTGTVGSISGGRYTGTIYTGFEDLSPRHSPSWPYAGGSSVRRVRFVDAIRPRSMDYWFEGMGCTSMDLARLDTSDVTSMSFTFSSCSSLFSLDVSSFDTSKVTSMSNMFYGCSSLNSLDLSTFDTSKVTSMTDMFSYCLSLASLDVSSFDTSQVRSMYEMFNYCESLASLDLSSFDTSKVTDMSEMFYVCNSLDKIAFGDKFVVN